MDLGTLKEDVGVLKDDIRLLKDDVGMLKDDVRQLRADVALGELRLEKAIAELRADMNGLKADLTWRFVAWTAFLGSVLSLINIFAD